MLTLSFTVAALACYHFWFYVPVVSQPVLTGEYNHRTIKVDGIERNYATYTPTSLSDNPKLLFFLHGATRTADIVRQQSAYEFDVQADRHGFIVVYPNGYHNH
jgi:polyhydroxybutyrate depolymerase